ncbi:MAG: hypothetical protein Kow0040_12250 [Thermogutta sp.]
MANDQPQRDRWQELASLLGIAPPAEGQPASGTAGPSLESAGDEPPPLEVTSEPSVEKSDSPPTTPPAVEASGDAARSIGIPIRADWKRERKAGNWEAVTAELGLVPTQTMAPPAVQETSRVREEEPERAETEPRGAHAGRPSKRPQTDAVVLDPVSRTVEPPALPEAEMVAMTLPDADASNVDEKVVAVEPASVTGLELERAVVAPPEIPQDVESQLAPLEAAVGEFADESSAVAADTITTVTALQEGRPKRKRRRRRRKTPIAIASEPFEAELPSIVAEAAADGDDDDELDSALEVPEMVAVETVEPEKSAGGRRDRGRQRRPRDTSVPADSEDESAEDHDAAVEGEGKSAHKAVPTWAETVAHVIQKNMENRRRRGGSGRGRDRS